MHGFISPWGMYFLSSVTCLTHIPLWWLGWPVDAEWYADLPVCTATTLPLYGHQDDLISGNDALVPCDCRWSTGMWYLPFCQYAKKTILGQKKIQLCCETVSHFHPLCYDPQAGAPHICHPTQSKTIIILQQPVTYCCNRKKANNRQTTFPFKHMNGRIQSLLKE